MTLQELWSKRVLLARKVGGGGGGGGGGGRKELETLLSVQ